jgi:hypothetical protein
MVGYVFKLCGQLAIDGFDDLAEQDEEAANRLRELTLLVTPGQGEQTNAIVLPEFGCFLCTDERPVADDVPVCMLGQEFAADSQVRDAGRSQLEVEDEAAPGGQEMELVAEDRLFSGGDLAKICAMGCPIAARVGR